MRKIILIIATIYSIGVSAQNVGIYNLTGATPNPFTMLDVDISTNNKGILIPRLTTAERTAIGVLGATEDGLILYDTDTKSLWIYNGIAWEESLMTSDAWDIGGNAGTTAGTDFLGTTDATDLVIKTNSAEVIRFANGGFIGINKAIPAYYLDATTTDPTKDIIVSTHTSNSTTLAYFSVKGEVVDAATSVYTSAQGYLAYHNTNNKTYGIYGTGGTLAGYFQGLIGINSVSSDLSGHDIEIRSTPTSSAPATMLLRRYTQATVAGTEIAVIDFGDNYNAVGQAKIQVLREETSTNNADMPTSIGFFTINNAAAAATEKFRVTNKGQLETFNTGSSIFIGAQAGELDDLSANLNVFVGDQSGKANVTGANNVFLGYLSGSKSTVSGNTGLGSNTLLNTTTGASNTAIGYNALSTNISGANNVAVGLGASLTSNSSNNTALGYGALNLATGANNIAIGYQAGNNITTGGSNIIIGYDIDAPGITTSNQLNIGNLIYGTGVDGTATTLSTGNIGVGITSPGVRFEVSSSAASDGIDVSNTAVDGDPVLRFQLGNTTQFTMGVNDGSTDQFTIAGAGSLGTASDFFTILSTGATGIGTIAPSEKLEVVGNIRSTTLAGTGSRVMQADANGTFTSLAAGTASQVLLGTGVWGSVPAGANNWSTLGNATTVATTNFIGTTDAIDFVVRTNNTEQIRVLSGGNVGIGTNAPGVKLEVESNLASDGVEINNTLLDGDPILQYSLSGVNKFTMGVDDADADKFKIAAGSTLGTAATDHFTIESTGNVGVGIASPGAKFEVGSGAASDGIDISNTALDGDPILRFQLDNITKFTMGVNDGSTDQFTIAGAASLGTVSDFLTILNTGETGIGITAPTVNLQVDGGSDATLANGTGYFLTNIETATNIVIDDDEIMARNNGAKSTLLMQDLGGSLLVHNAVAGTEFAILDGGNVGIGTGAPTTLLEMVGGATGVETNVLQVRSNFGTANTATTIKLINSPTSGSASGSAEITAIRTLVGGNTNLLFRTYNGTTLVEQMRILDNGNVGLGINAPTVNLQVAGGTNATLANGTGYFLTNIETATNIVIDDDEIMARNNGAKSTLLMQDLGGSLLVHNAVAGTEFAVLDNGNVGIGTSSPGVKLEVVSNLASDGLEINNTLLDGDPVLQFSLSGTNQFTMGVNDGLSDNFQISAGSTLGGIKDWFTIEPLGDVGVGTTNPGVKFEVSSSTATSDGIDISNSYGNGTTTFGDPVLRFQIGNTTKFTMGVDDSDVDKFKIKNGASLGTADLFVIEQTTGDIGFGISNPTVQLELSRDEGKKPSTSTWTVTSDERLKNIEGKYTKGLTEILKLNPIVYHYKDVEDKKFSKEVLRTKAVGFSAQEVQEIFPESVQMGDDGYLSLNIHAILIAYVNAIKEQQNMIEQQKSKINNQEKRLQALEKIILSK